MRKASMKVVNANANSTFHNNRINPPKYLIEDENFKDNYYEQIHTDAEFRKLAELKYLSKNNQRMQEKQKVALIKETVLNLEERHTPEDVKKLFEKLNKEYGGHYVLDIAFHRDEGHFLKDGIPYYPTKHILKKDDDWYIVPLEKFLDKDFKPTKKDFSEKVDISEFKKVKNIHAHVKFSMFDLNTGLTGRMTKGQVSKRLKFVADELKLAYVPEQKISSGKAIKTIKDEHDLRRRAQIQELYLKQENSQLQEQNNQLQYNFREYQKRITAIQDADKEQKKELHRLNTSVKNKDATVELLESKIQELETKVYSEKYLVDDEVAENAEIVEYLEKEVENRDITVARLKAEKEALQIEEKNRYDEYRKQVDAEYQKNTEKELISARERTKELETENSTLQTQIQALENREPQIKEVEKIVQADNTELKKQIAEYANTSIYAKSEEKMPEKFKIFDFIKHLINNLQQWKEAYFKKEKENKELKADIERYKPIYDAEQKKLQESVHAYTTEQKAELKKMIEKNPEHFRSSNITREDLQKIDRERKTKTKDQGLSL